MYVLAYNRPHSYLTRRHNITTGFLAGMHAMRLYILRLFSIGSLYCWEG